MKELKLLEVKFYRVAGANIWELFKDLEIYTNSNLINQYNEEEFGDMEFNIEFEHIIDEMLVDYINTEDQISYFQVEDEFNYEDLLQIKLLCEELRSLNQSYCVVQYYK